ncbi:lytic transglycosylase domain-containing protein [Sphingobium sp. RAC03]|uniref:lytic transglycosylase domain-containing protein n=1 Tax=Sphingobium sp. RAC03 TaxID=1843368 RepID=UPI00083D48BA|nr:lytic transglycosylase domain-containing protein [Sphingobium sp. RAC03]AOF98509.1 transglycosylase SLT domain protein [Sphingobium sp. RAC03]
MRSYLLCGVAILMGSGTMLQAAPQGRKAVRSVQLISMTGATPAPASPEVPAPDAGRGEETEPSVDNGPVLGEFRVHDLSRRWVEFQMASSFTPRTPSAAQAAVDDDDPFAHVGVAQLGAAPVAGYMIPSVSSMPIPAWMRGGPVFAAAVNRYVPGCTAAGYRPSGFLTADTEYRRQNYYSMMSNIACQYGIPVGLFDAMIIRESRYQSGVYSPKNAFGLTQLMPDTAVGLGVNRYNVADNLRGGAKYLREQLDRFGQYHLALAAYNAGPGRVRNGLVPRIAETQAYVDDILMNWSRLSGLSRVGTVQTPSSPSPSVQRARFGRSATVSTF